VEMQGDGCVERTEFERRTAFAREASKDFREKLKQDESDSL